MPTQSRRDGTCNGPEIGMTPACRPKSRRPFAEGSASGLHQWSISGACQAELRQRQRHVPDALGQQSAEAQVYNVWIMERT